MTAENGRPPFSIRGKIEASMGARLHPGIVEDFNETRLDVKPFDPVESEEAKTISRLFVGEPSVLCDLYGNPWLQIITPCKRKEDRGQLLEQWVHPKNIFTTRDAITHIIENYSKDGIQFRHRDKAAKTMNFVIDRLQEGPINDEQGIEFRNQTIEGMAESGYLSSVYPERVATAAELVRATEKDSLDRSNSSRGRVIGNSRRPQVIKDGLIAGTILKKNKRRLSVVEGVCDLIEQDFVNISRFAEVLSDNNTGTGAFESELPGFRNIVKFLLSPKGSVLPKPYSELGAKIRYALHPRHYIGDAITLSRYMDPFEALDIADEYRAGFDQLENPEQKKARITDVTKLLDSGLKAIALQRYESYE